MIRTPGIFQQQKTLHSAGATDEYIDFEQVADDFVLEVTHLSVENQTTAYTRLVIGVKDGSIFHEHEAEESPAADIVYWTRSRIYVPEGCNLRCKLTGNTSADVIQAHLQGIVKRRCTYNV